MNLEKPVFRPSNLLGAHVNTPIEDKLFQDISRRVAKFRENRPSDVENSVDGKEKIKKKLHCVSKNVPPLQLAIIFTCTVRL